MPVGPNLTSTWQAIFPVILASAREYVEKPTLMTSRNTVTTVTLKDGQGLTYYWPKFGTPLEAQVLEEGVPITTRQQIVPTVQQFTTQEIGVSVLMTDRALRVVPENMQARAGRFAGNAMRRKMETDMISLLSGFSRVLGGAGVTFNPNWIAAARVRLAAGAEANQKEPATGVPTAVLHPFQLHAVLTASATLGSNINDNTGRFPIPGWTDELIREYDVRQLYGVTVATTPYIPIDSNGDAYGAIFTRDALIHVKTSHVMRTEMDRDIDLRAHWMVMTAEYGFGELEDQWGISILADASVPTG